MFELVATNTGVTIRIGRLILMLIQALGMEAHSTRPHLSPWGARPGGGPPRNR